MIITCNNCNKKFDIDSSLIPDKGRLLQCVSCDHKWFFKKEVLENTVIPIDEDININDTPCKYTLLAEIKELFDIFQSKGDTYLNQSEGHCLHCSYGAITRIFTGNNSGHQYSLKYTIKDNEVIELMQCNYSNGHHLKAKQE